MIARDAQGDAYATRLDEERRHFDSVETFDDLPPIYHYWSHTFVRPMLEPLGCTHPRELLAHYLHESARRCAVANPVFLSIGSGDANNEIEAARLIEAQGLTDFTIECLEMNPALIERASAAAQRAGVGARLTFVQQDFNAWQPSRTYHGIMANQTLHHVVNLEGLFDAVRTALAPNALFAVSDIIGRNGHQRWPETRRLVERFWNELPPAYRYHRQLRRYEEQFADWDCSGEGFEGIRAQDILPLLIERFAFEVFVGFGGAIDPFVDRGFGPNFDATAQWDRAFIDRVHACDEQALQNGDITPTHMIAIVTLSASEASSRRAAPYYARGLTPERCVRNPNRVFTHDEFARADEALAPFFRSPERWLPLRGPARQTGDIHGWSEDDWVGETLEFAIVPLRNLTHARVHVTMPPSLPPGTMLSLHVGDAHTSKPATAPYTVIECAAQLTENQAATIRMTTSATVNLKALGIAEDLRNLGFHLDSIAFE